MRPGHGGVGAGHAVRRLPPALTTLRPWRSTRRLRPPQWCRGARERVPAPPWPGSVAAARRPTRSSSRCCRSSERPTPRPTLDSSSAPTRSPSGPTRARSARAATTTSPTPLAVTTILAELGMTPTTLAAALLHDTVEDTEYSLEALRRDFGEEVAMLVDGVTKLDKVTYGQAAQAETVRKMVIAMARDIRVLVIKLADRLHNARTWRYVSRESAQRKARETLEIYAPLAHRLGMNTIKWELEDLSFQALYPKVYDEIVRLVAERAPAREEYLAGVREQVGADLRAAKIKATVTGRPKHYYSVYQKMIVGGSDFERDLRPGRRARPRRHRPRLLRRPRRPPRAVEPRARAVQGLHRDAEVQHVPVAAHDGHRPRGQGRGDPDPHPRRCTAAPSTASPRTGSTRRTGSPRTPAAPTPPGPRRQHDPAGDMAWLRQLLDWQKETADPGEFLESLRFEINAQRGLRLHPQGRARRAARRLHPGRLRLRGAHRGGPPLHRRPRQRAPRAAGEPSSTTATSWRC